MGLGGGSCRGEVNRVESKRRSQLRQGRGVAQGVAQGGTGYPNHNDIKFRRCRTTNHLKTTQHRAVACPSSDFLHRYVGNHDHLRSPLEGTAMKRTSCCLR